MKQLPEENVRLIARLDVKGPHLIKGIQLEGVRKIGDPREFARRYYADGVDEILYMDAVASLYDRDVLHEIVRHTAEDVFVPITAGGGLRSVEDVRAMLRAGADKVAINTAATLRPGLVTEIAETFGSQCMVLQIDAKRRRNGGWEVYRDGGREHTGLDVVEWAKQVQDLGAGEILLTSIDQEGTQAGFDISLIEAVASAVSVPLIASGGLGKPSDAIGAATAGADGVAVAAALHLRKYTAPAIRGAMVEAGVPTCAHA